MSNLHKLPRLGILCLLLLVPFVTATAQDDPDRQKAFQLYKEPKFTEALPLFEKLATAHPDDREIAELHAILVSTQAVYLKDPEARKQARIRGRELLLRAQKLGANSPLLHSLLEGITPEGDIAFPPTKQVAHPLPTAQGHF